MLTNDQLPQWDRDNFFHPSTHLAEFARGNAPQRIITTAKDCHITDRDGTRLLDAFAGLYCVNVGYGRQEIAEAIADQARELAYYHAYVGHGTEASITPVSPPITKITMLPTAAVAATSAAAAVSAPIRVARLRPPTSKLATSASPV